MIWQDATTAQRIEAIKEARKAGAISLSQIAAMIGGVSRNAVAGIFNRFPAQLVDVPLRKSVHAEHPRRGVKRNPSKGRNNVGNAIVSRRLALEAVEAAPVIVPDDFDQTKARFIPLHELERGECKWPVNDPPKGEAYLFCGCRQKNGSPYCDHHTSRAYGGHGALE